MGEQTLTVNGGSGLQTTTAVARPPAPSGSARWSVTGLFCHWLAKSDKRGQRDGRGDDWLFGERGAGVLGSVGWKQTTGPR